MNRLLLALIILLMLMPGLCGAQELIGRVKWIDDGDSLRVEGIGKVRLLGIDAPEWKEGYRDAYYIRQGVSPQTLRAVAKKSRDLLIAELKGRTVRLVTDSPPRDKYGRLLAYVFLDERLINRLLVEKGLASVYRKYPFSRKGEFLKAEDQARRKKLGLWANQR